MISWPHDLTNSSVERVLRGHFNDSGLKVLSATDSEEFLTTNDNFNSDIKKISVVFQRSNEGYSTSATEQYIYTTTVLTVKNDQTTSESKINALKRMAIKC